MPPSRKSGGHGIATQGDAFFAAFRRAKDAVHAALAAQRALVSHAWPEGGELRVRMGIHTGEAVVADGEYQGLAIHRAARICGVCNGGEIRLSQATYALLDDEEHDVSGFMLVDLGEQRLKDFERPVRVYQLMAAVAAEPGAAAVDDNGCIRVLIVDDQALVRAGFRMILDADADIEVVGEAADGGEAVEEALRLKPHVVLMDVRMPAVDGIEATRILLGERGSDAKVVMLTTFDMDEYVYEALRAGASGFLLKDVPPEQLVEGIRAVASGDALLAPAVTRRVIEEFVRQPSQAQAASPPPPQLEELTPRELEVLKLIARGHVERRDRRRARPQPGDGEDARRPRADEARAPRPGAGRRARVRVRPRRIRRLATSASRARGSSCRPARAPRPSRTGPRGHHQWRRLQE